MLLDLKSWTNQDLCSWLVERKCVTDEAMKKLQEFQMNGYLLDQSLDEIKQVLKENLSATDTYRLMNEIQQLKDDARRAKQGESLFID